MAPSRNYITASALHHFQAKSQVSQQRQRCYRSATAATLGGYSACSERTTQFLYRDLEANNNNDMAKKLPWRFCLLTGVYVCVPLYASYSRCRHNYYNM